MTTPHLFCLCGFFLQLRLDGLDPHADLRLSAWDTFQAKLFDLVGLDSSQAQRDAWRSDLVRRAKRSSYRQTVEFKRKRKKQRAEQTKSRGQLRSDHTYQYKGSTGGGQRSGRSSGNGAAGACQCSGQCCRNCPCRSASKSCTPLCHPARTCKNAACDHTLVLRTSGSSGSSSAAAGSSGDSSAAGAGTARAARGSTRPDLEWAGADPNPPALDKTLVGRKIWFNFPDYGWVEGTVAEENFDVEETDGDEVANFIVEYDDGDQGHDLQHSEYSARTDAPGGSWYVVRAQDDTGDAARAQ